MAKKKKPSANYYNGSAEEAEHEFDISRLELQTLMETRDSEGLRQLNETYGGLNGLEQKLETNVINGLSDDETALAKRAAAFGCSEIPRRPPKALLLFIVDASKNPTLIILIILCIISLASSSFSRSKETLEAEIKGSKLKQHQKQCAAIIIAVVIVVLVTMFKNWMTERYFHSSQSKNEHDHKLNVVRDSTVREISEKDIVVGDICQIKHGDLLPADGIVVESNHLKIDESSLTGEPDLISKHQSNDPFLLTGTNTMGGNGKMLVLAVGEYTQTGIALQLLIGNKEESNIEEKLVKNKKPGI